MSETGTGRKNHSIFVGWGSNFLFPQQETWPLIALEQYKPPLPCTKYCGSFQTRCNSSPFLFCFTKYAGARCTELGKN